MKLYVVILLWLFMCDINCLESPEITIKQGRLKGKIWRTKRGRQISAFLSIPYAEPPIEELRFKPPVAAKAWEGILEATNTHPVCPQRNKLKNNNEIIGEENCLFLNVYTPKLSSFQHNLYPVMIYFHGGGWFYGSGNSDWFGPDILLDKDIVLVIPNYRLGPFGFLSTGDEIVPGNNGLKDQNLAMKWVKSNINKFGGDPEKITIFGQSSGGASVHYHMLSPLSRDLFHGAISQSGTANVFWALAREGKTVANSKKLAESLGCAVINSQIMVECLQKIDAYEIISKDIIFMEWHTDPMIPFKPRIEPKLKGAFLTEDPTVTIKSGRSANVPWVTGINTEDGGSKVAVLYKNSTIMESISQDFDKIVSISLINKILCSNSNYISDKIRQFYFGEQEITNNTRFQFIDMYTDGWFLSGADKSVTLHAKYTQSPVYYYLFGHQGLSSFGQIYSNGSQRYGVCHNDELLHLFPLGDSFFPNHQPDDVDNRASEIVTTLWTNFAKFGNPTPTLNRIIHAKWIPVQSDDLDYYYIDRGVHAAKGLLFERAKFWRNLPISQYTNCNKDEL